MSAIAGDIGELVKADCRQMERCLFLFWRAVLSVAAWTVKTDCRINREVFVSKCTVWSVSVVSCDRIWSAQFCLCHWWAVTEFEVHSSVCVNGELWQNLKCTVQSVSVVSCNSIWSVQFCLCKWWTLTVEYIGIWSAQFGLCQRWTLMVEYVEWCFFCMSVSMVNLDGWVHRCFKCTVLSVSVVYCDSWVRREVFVLKCTVLSVSVVNFAVSLLSRLLGITGNRNNRESQRRAVSWLCLCCCLKKLLVLLVEKNSNASRKKFRYMHCGHFCFSFCRQMCAVCLQYVYSNKRFRGNIHI